MGIVEGWIDWAERRDGIPDKVYSQPNRGEGIAMHSVVGNLPNHRIPGRFLDTTKANGRYVPAAAASCMFILYRDGHLVQMYPVTASTWTSGGFDGNTRYWAVEAEGGLNPTNEPLEKPAEDTFIRLVTEWENEKPGRRAQPGVNLLQHKEIARKYGYAATACASDRYDGALVRIIAGERYRETGADMTKEEIEKLIDQRLALAFAVDNADDVRLAHFRKLLNLAVNGGEGAFADAQGKPLPLIRDVDLVNRVAELEAAKPEPRVKVIRTVASALIAAGEEIGRAGETE